MHPSLIQASRKDLKFKYKPWMTKALLKSIQTLANKLYKDCFKQNNIQLLDKYKKYSNILTITKTSIKTFYHKTEIEKHKFNISKQWKIINEIINKNNKQSHFPITIT